MQPPILGWNGIKVWWRSNMFVCLICLRCFRYGTTFQALWFTCFIANRGLKHQFLGWNKTFSPRSNPAGSVENDPVTTTILRDPTKYSFLGQIVLGPPTQKTLPLKTWSYAVFLCFDTCSFDLLLPNSALLAGSFDRIAGATENRCCWRSGFGDSDFDGFHHDTFSKITSDPWLPRWDSGTRDGWMKYFFEENMFGLPGS